MFAVRRAALRLISSPSTSFITKPRALSTYTVSASRIYSQSTAITFQKRWASDSAVEKEDAPISKLQPTPQEEVENAVQEDNASAQVASPSLEETGEGQAEVDTAVEAAGDTTVNAAEDAAVDAESAAPDQGFATNSDSYSMRRGSSDGPREVAPPSDCVYVGNLFLIVTEDDITKEMSRFGGLKNVKLIRDARGLSKGFGYATFDNIEEATAAVRGLNQQVFEGRRLTVQFAISKTGTNFSERRWEKPLNPPSKTLFIGNMSWEMTDRDLNDMFRGIRNVIDVRVAIDRRTGQPRGFAHADFTDVRSAMDALKVLSGKDSYGRPLKLDYSYGASGAPRTQANDAGQSRP